MESRWRRTYPHADRALCFCKVSSIFSGWAPNCVRKCGSGGKLATLSMFGPSDYAAIGEDGFFAATPAAMTHLALKRGAEVIPVPDDYKAAFMKELNLD